MTVVIRLIGLASRAIVTPHDGRFLVDYDPTWRAEPHRFGLMVGSWPRPPDRRCQAVRQRGRGKTVSRPGLPKPATREANGAINRPLTAFVIELIARERLEAHREAVNEPFSPWR